ncbi:hypothetical protein [Streptomyces peucetius]
MAARCPVAALANEHGAASTGWTRPVSWAQGVDDFQAHGRVAAGPVMSRPVRVNRLRRGQAQRDNDRLTR